MAGLKKRGKIWYVEYKFQGKRGRISTRTDNKKIAQMWLDDIIVKIANKTLNRDQDKTIKINLTDFFEEYFQDASVEKKATTIFNERKYADAFIKKMNNCPISSVDLRLLKHWKTDMLTRKKKDGNCISPTTFNIHRRFLKAAFNVAIDYEYIKVNPFNKLKEMKVDEIRLNLADDEVDTILKFIDEDISKLHVKRHKVFLERYRILFEFLLNTGLRVSEAINLETKNVDIKNGIIHIEKTKSRKTRIIPLNEVAKECLIEIGDGLFHSFDPNHVSRKFHHYVVKAGYTGFKLHSLRHTFATNLSDLGEDISVIQKLLGHQDIRTTQIYAKANTERMRSAVNKLNKDSKVDGNKNEDSKGEGTNNIDGKEPDPVLV